MQHAEDVEEDVELVREPEEAVRLLPDQRVREQEDDAHHGVKHYAWEISIFKKLNVNLWLYRNSDITSNSGEGPEEPVVDVGLLVRGEAEFGGEAVEVLEGLRGHVVKVDEVHRGVHEGEEEGGARAYLGKEDIFQGRYYWWRLCLIRRENFKSEGKSLRRNDSLTVGIWTSGATNAMAIRQATRSHVFLLVTFAQEKMRFLGALAFMSIFGFINSYNRMPEAYGDFLIQLSFNRQDREV